MHIAVGMKSIWCVCGSTLVWVRCSGSSDWFFWLRFLCSWLGGGLGCRFGLGRRRREELLHESWQEPLDIVHGISPQLLLEYRAGVGRFRLDKESACVHDEHNVFQ